jgi:hypothetical protein
VKFDADIFGEPAPREQAAPDPLDPRAVFVEMPLGHGVVLECGVPSARFLRATPVAGVRLDVDTHGIIETPHE